MNRLILTIHWPKSHISAHAICIIFLLSWSHAFAEDNTLLGTSNNDIVALLDEPRNFLSYNLLNFSDSIDQIFSNTENFSSDNSSYARLSVASVWLDEGRPYPLTDAYIYFSLPRTEDRFSLLLQTDAAEDSDSDGVNLLPGSPSRKSNALALRGNIISGTTWHITADIGTKLSTTLDPFVRMTYLQKNQFQSWSLLWRESIYLFAYQGSGLDNQVRADYPLGDRFHLRMNNQLSFFEQDEISERSHQLGLYQKLSDHAALSYAVGFYQTVEPFDNVYYAQLRYKSLLHDTWLYYEIIPEYIYPKSTNFTATPKLTIKFEMLLGNP